MSELTFINKTPDIKRVIQKEELKESDYGERFAELSRIFHHAVVEMNDGIWRWCPNALIKWIGLNHRHLTDLKSGFEDGISYNEMFAALLKNEFSIEEHAKFYMQTGYSLSGFSEVYDQRTAKEMKLKDCKGNESVIDYWVRRYHDASIYV